MDHSHTNYFLPFDAATYFDSAAAAAAATYNPYTDFYSHQQPATSSSTTAAAAASYHQMYRTTPTTLRHPSFYSATMQSKFENFFCLSFIRENIHINRSSIIL
jgi:hypothetical protein